MQSRLQDLVITMSRKRGKEKSFLLQKSCSSLLMTVLEILRALLCCINLEILADVVIKRTNGNFLFFGKRGIGVFLYASGS
jgi:hypothetical protein